MKELWIVKVSSGQYDDYSTWDVIAFSTEQSAKDYVASIPEPDYGALRELEELRTEYCGAFYETQFVEDFTDEQWDNYYTHVDELERLALTEVQEKYPDADLMVDENFNGYFVQGPVEFGG